MEEATTFFVIIDPSRNLTEGGRLKLEEVKIQLIRCSSSFMLNKMKGTLCTFLLLVCTTAVLGATPMHTLVKQSWEFWNYFYLGIIDETGDTVLSSPNYFTWNVPSFNTGNFYLTAWDSVSATFYMAWGDQVVPTPYELYAVSAGGGGVKRILNGTVQYVTGLFAQEGVLYILNELTNQSSSLSEIIAYHAQTGKVSVLWKGFWPGSENPNKQFTLSSGPGRFGGNPSKGLFFALLTTYYYSNQSTYQQIGTINVLTRSAKVINLSKFREQITPPFVGMVFSETLQMLIGLTFHGILCTVQPETGIVKELGQLPVIFPGSLQQSQLVLSTTSTRRGQAAKASDVYLHFYANYTQDPDTSGFLFQVSVDKVSVVTQNPVTLPSMSGGTVALCLTQ
jgi:hypothetical protein